MRIKQWLVLHKILWKQYFCKHNRWLLVLLCLAFSLRFFGNQEKEEYAGFQIGVLISDGYGQELLERLQGNADDVFKFCVYQNEEALLRDVKNGTLECGYELPEGFFEEIAHGKMRNQITLYYTTASGAHKLSYEVVFSHLFAMLSEEVLKEFADREGLEEDAFEELLQLKELYEGNDTTFSFVFEQVGEGTEQENQTQGAMRGIVGLLVFFLALLGLANCYEIRERTGGFPRKEAKRIERAGRHIAVVGSVAAGGFFLFLAGIVGEPVKELWALVVYAITLEIFLWILRWLLPVKEAIYGAIPVLLLGSILFCPVFFHAEAFFPIVGYLGRIFPLYWYLR